MGTKSQIKTKFSFSDHQTIFLQVRTRLLELNERRKKTKQLWIFIQIGGRYVYSMRLSCIFLDKCKLQKKMNLIFPVMTKKKQQVLAIFFPCTVFSKDNPRLYIIVLVYLVLPSGAFWASR